MKNLLKLITLIFFLVFGFKTLVSAAAEVKAEFDVDVSAFVDIDSFSTLEVNPTNNEVGLQSDLVVRVLDRNGTPLSGHTIHFYIEDGEGTVLFVQPSVSDADGYARGKVRSLSEGAFVIRAYDTTYGESVVLSDSDTFYVFPVPTPQLESEPYYTKGSTNKLFWEEVEGLDEYEYYIQVATDSSFNSIFKNSGWVSSQAYEFNGLSGGQIYFYRVKARNSSEAESGWSNVRFSVQDNQPPIIKVSDVKIQKNNGNITSIVIKLDITDDLSLNEAFLYCKRENGNLEECGVLEHTGSSYIGSISVSDLERGSLFALLDEYTFCILASDEAGNESSNCEIKVSTVEQEQPSPIPIFGNIIDKFLDGATKLINDLDKWVTDFLNDTKEEFLSFLSLLLLALAFIISVAILTGSFLLVPAYISSWLYNSLKFIGLKPHGRPTGFIYDVVTKRPVKWAFIEIYDGNNNLVWRDFSNPEGEFMADLPAGKYRVSVKTPNYLFPSQLVKPREDRKLGKIYKGEYLMTSKKNPLQVAIPMDPVNMRIGEEFSFWSSKRTGMLKSFNVLAVVLGLGLAIYLFGRTPSLFNTLVLLFYIPAVFVYLKSLFKVKLG